jgi:hypothetical protein
MPPLLGATTLVMGFIARLASHTLSRLRPYEKIPTLNLAPTKISGRCDMDKFFAGIWHVLDSAAGASFCQNWRQRGGGRHARVGAC